MLPPIFDCKLGICHNYSKRYFGVKDLILDNNEIQLTADEENFCQINKKRSSAMKIVHEARVLDECVMESAKAAGMDVDRGSKGKTH